MSVEFKMALSPDGGEAYVTGGESDADLSVVSLDTETGARIWMGHDDDDEPSIGEEMDVVASPDGEHVIATGGVNGDTREIRDQLTVAFDAATGEQRWSAVYDRPTSDRAESVSIGPGSETAYIAGRGGAVAYDLENGTELWSYSREEVQENGSENAVAFAVDVDPDGETVYVGVKDFSGPERVIAFDAATGDVLWDVEAPDDGPEKGLDFEVSSDGSTVVIATGEPTGHVAAFDTTDGEVLWGAQMATPPLVFDAFVNPYAVAIGPDSETVYVQATEYSLYPDEPGYVYAFDLREGDTEWVHVEPGGHWAGWHSQSMDVSSDGESLYTSFKARYPGQGGFSMRTDFATLALDAADGERRWKAGVPCGAHCQPSGTLVAPDDSRVYALNLFGPSVGVLAYETGDVGPAPTQAEAAGVPDLLPTPLTSADVPMSPPSAGEHDLASTLESSATRQVSSISESQASNLQLRDDLHGTLDDPTLSARDEIVDSARTAVDQRRALAEDGALNPELAGPLDRQATNLDLSENLLETGEGIDHEPMETAFEQAELALTDRRAMVQGGFLESADTSGLDRQMANLDTARDIIDEGDRQQSSDLAESIAIAQRATRHQADSLDIDWDDPNPTHTSKMPSDAARNLVQRYEASLSAHEESQLDELDGLPDPVRAELTTFLEAFLAFDRAVEEAYADVDEDALQTNHQKWSKTRHAAKRADGIVTDPTEWEHPQSEQQPTPGDIPLPDDHRSLASSLEEAGLDLSGVLHARSSLLDAGLELHNALEDTTFATDGGASVSVPPALSLDLAAEDSTYTEDYALIVDAGGDDRYANNAGGSNILQAHEGDCRGNTTNAAAVFDLGAGDDDYTSAKRNCGVRGGGYMGAGLLVDAGGTDVFAPYEPQPPEMTGLESEGISFENETAPDSNQAASAERNSASERYIVGVDSPDQPTTGDEFHDATVIKTNPTLGYVVVEANGEASFLGQARSDPMVHYVEEDARVHLDEVPNDPLYAEQYGPQQINAPEAWDTSVGDPSHNVCVVDTGVDYTHPDLNGSRWMGGYDFADDDPDPMDPDNRGHGTHVAGIAAATIDNDEGVAGAANTGLLAVKSFPQFGGAYVSDIADGIQWCADNDGDVISMSFSYDDEFEAIHTAIQYSWDEGSLLVASAGNNGCFDCFAYPHSYEEVIPVSCTDRDEELCSYSTYGPGIELAAPGDELLSTEVGGSYGERSGTSMSAPHVSGVAALVWSQAPDLTNGELRQLLRDTARDVGPPGCDEQFGQGIVDADAALEAALEGARPTLDGWVVECLSGGYFGSNGGGHEGGLGLLIAAGEGEDEFSAGGLGTNGGGSLGLGMLVSDPGDDAYLSGERGTNGGGSTVGTGVLIDTGGNNSYSSFRYGTNGGSDTGGSGFLLEMGTGDTTYDVSRHYGTNGGAAYGATDGVSTGFLLDAGGNDEYWGDGAGANGGSYVRASGLLLDARGDDVYAATSHGVNGGSYGGGYGNPRPAFGFLVDVTGDDAYQATQAGTNGGGMNLGAGFLIDAAGDDTYNATEGAINGGGAGEATGFLLDASGANSYNTNYGAANGGAAVTILSFTGVGFLFDAGMQDTTYTSSKIGTNGGAVLGSGMLLDAGGDDTYTSSFSAGNGGGVNGAGFLLDHSGDDAYEGTYWGINGGGFNNGAGFLMDTAGNDSYQATHGGTNGGGWQQGASGFLVDADGNDAYTATGTGTNGGGVEAAGFLADARGSDRYVATDEGTNGGGFLAGSGALLDAAGDDTYKAGECGANGGAAEGCFLVLGVDLGAGTGILFDGEGTDSYDDAVVDCQDCTQAPKGAAGAQVDGDGAATLAGRTSGGPSLPALGEEGPATPSTVSPPSSTLASHEEIVGDPDCSTPLIDDRCEDWTAEANPNFKMAVSPDSELVFTDDFKPWTGLGVAAFDADTGERVWTSYEEDEDDGVIARVWDIDVSPDGEHVVATGATDAQANNKRDTITAAFDATTGEKVWTSRYNDSDGRATGVAIGPASQTAYVASYGGAIAYDLGTGEELWLHSDDELAENGSDHAQARLVQTAPDGDTVYVAVGDRGSGPNRAMALDAGTGDPLWDTPTSDSDAQYVLDFDLSADGESLVMATGRPLGFVTVFDTSEGEILWDTQMDTLPFASDGFLNPYGTAIGPDSQTVYVQATDSSLYPEEPAYVFAYGLRNGSSQWTHIEPGGHYAGWGSRSIDVSPDGEDVYTSFKARYPGTGGFSMQTDFATLALNASTGDKLWKAGAPCGGHCQPAGTQVAPDGSRVYALNLYGPPELLAYETGGDGGSTPLDGDSASPAPVREQSAPTSDDQRGPLSAIAPSNGERGLVAVEANG